MKKFVSWNVNGIRACMKKGFIDFFKEVNADIFCLQETKLSEGQLDLSLNGYKQFWNYAEKKGYSGTAIFTKENPKKVIYGMGIDEHDREGRIISLEFESYFLINSYTPNSQRGLTRLEYRMKWEDEFKKYCISLSKRKPIIICGDLNVAHKEIDLKNPKSNKRNAGFTDEERGKFNLLIDDFLIDTYRFFYPEKRDMYTWWSYMRKARENNTGWRIDYFLIEKILKNNIIDAHIYSEIMGSDHCPIEISIEI